MRQQFTTPTTETPDMASFVARFFRRPPPPVTLSRRAERVLVLLPTQMDLDSPTTREALAALAITAHVLASIVERRTGIPTTARECYDDVRGLLSAYTRTYRRVAGAVDGRTR